MDNDRLPPRNELRRTLALFPDGRILARYNNGTYWILGETGSYIPARKVSMKQAAIRVVHDDAVVLNDLEGMRAFYKAVAEEEAHATDVSREEI